MSLDAANHHLRPAFAAKLMQMIAQGIVFQAGEFDLLDDRSVIAKRVAKRRHGRSDPARILLGD